MALEVDPSRKIQLRNRGELMPPGCCAVCGSADPDRSYVDFGLWYDYEGGIYICSLCFDEAATKVVGYFTEDQHKELLNHNNKLLLKVEELQTEIDNVQPILAAIRTIGISRDDSVSAGGDSNLDPSETAEQAGSGESEVTEHATSEGRSDVSGTQPGNRGKPVIV